MNLEVVNGFHDSIVFHCYKNRNRCLNSNEQQRGTGPSDTAELVVEPPNPHSGEWRSSFLAKDRKLRPYSSTGLSGSAAAGLHRRATSGGRSRLPPPSRVRADLGATAKVAIAKNSWGYLLPSIATKHDLLSYLQTDMDVQMFVEAGSGIHDRVPDTAVIRSTILGALS